MLQNSLKLCNSDINRNSISEIEIDWIGRKRTKEAILLEQSHFIIGASADEPIFLSDPNAGD